MAREKIGAAIFVGLVGATGLISSGAIVDVNPWLSNWNKAAIERDAEKAVSAQGGDTAPTAEETDDAATADESDQNQTPASEEQQPQDSDASDSDASSAENDDVATDADADADTDASEDEEKLASADSSEESSTDETPEAAEQTTDEDSGEKAEEAAVEPIIPTFDILRVEQDGSTLIAGVAAPSSQIELVAGARSIANTIANARGEFVAVLDEPLDKGDHEIVLRATAPDGSVLTSSETAIVSIPQEDDGEILALVEAPGAPSRLISKTETALVPVDETKSPSAEPEEEIADASEQSQDADDAAQVSEDAQSEDSQPATEIAANDDTETEPKQDAVEEQAAPKAQAADEAGPQLRIEAVEIDGPTVFVAGSAAAGSRIRVYANDLLLGDTISNQEGRFLVDVNRQLPVGDYLVRADSLSSNGSEVLARVAVPFTRSEGEKLAAIAVPIAPKLPDEPPTVPVDDVQVAKAPTQQAPDTSETNSEPSPQSAISDTEVAEEEAEAVEASSEDAAKPAEQTTEVAAAPSDQAPAEQTGLSERLSPVSQSVIIRRGDTLWQISRRTYGRGVKYTTIYAANQDQIKDPNKIWPGQVFSLPEEPEPEEE